MRKTVSFFSRSLTSSSSNSSCFSAVLIVDVGREEVREVGRLVHVHCRDEQLVRQVRCEAHYLAEQVERVSGKRLELDRVLDLVDKALDAGLQVGLRLRVVLDTEPCHTLDQQLHLPVGKLEHARYRHRRADVVEVTGLGLLLAVPERDHADDPVADKRLVYQLDQVVLGNQQRCDDVGEDDCIGQRHDRKLLGDLHLVNRGLGFLVLPAYALRLQHRLYHGCLLVRLYFLAHFKRTLLS